MIRNNSKKNDELLITLYKEAGINFRYFLDWRHRVMLGFFTILTGMIFLIQIIINNDNLKSFLWILPSVGIIISLSFFSMDYRNKILFRKCIAVGRNLENEMKINKEMGIYEEFDKLTRECKITHSVVLSFLYLGAVCGFSILLIYIIIKGI